MQVITKDQKVVRYQFLAGMAGEQVVKVYTYLHACHKMHPASPDTEIWDLGIGLCRERLMALGYSFIPLRAGYPDTIQHPDGSLTMPIAA